MGSSSEQAHQLTRLIHRALNGVRFLPLDKFEEVTEAFEKAIKMMEANLIEDNYSMKRGNKQEFNRGGGNQRDSNDNSDDNERDEGSPSGKGSEESNGNRRTYPGLSDNRIRKANKLQDLALKDDSKEVPTDQGYIRPITMTSKDMTLDTSSPSIGKRSLRSNKVKSLTSSRAKTASKSAPITASNSEDSIHIQQNQYGIIQPPVPEKNIKLEAMVKKDPLPQAKSFKTDYSSPSMDVRKIAPAKSVGASSRANSADAAPALSFDENEEPDVDTTKMLMNSPMQKHSHSVLLNLAVGNKSEVQKANAEMMNGLPSWGITNYQQNDNRSYQTSMTSRSDMLQAKSVVQSTNLDSPSNSFVKRLDSPGSRHHELAGKRKKLGYRLEYARDLIPRVDPAAYDDIKSALLEAMTLMEGHSTDK